MIKAPYNFVPLASKVVFPEWASQISIDRPFQDGISGTIEVVYTAQTPVFIGNGEKDDKLISNYQAANGKYAIPGSTLRGMLRNVIEIISFGKFNRVSEAALSVRDLQNSKLYSRHFTKECGCRDYESLSKAGWLIYEDNMWMLYPVVYHRVEDSVLKKVYPQLGDLEERKTVEDRMSPIRGTVSVYFTVDKNRIHQHHGGMKLRYSKVYELKRQNFSGSKHGFTVLTGQPGRSFNKKQKRKVGKHLDFIFEDKISGQGIPLAYETLLEFKQANTPKAADQKRGLDLPQKFNDSINIGYPGIPVFYLSDKKGEPTSLGLSMMYRLPYKNTLHDAIRHSSEDNFSDAMDFAECIFGKIENTKNKTAAAMNFSLRGRVQFEDATAEQGSLAKQVDTILGNPKPTYYPNYIEQVAKTGTYKTLMDSDVRLRGWKRYPVKNTPTPIPVEKEQEKVASHFQPLQKNTVFSGRVHFHNLKKEELGALLWAITWGNSKNLSHAVGMGKPYGFGQIKAEIASLTYLNNADDDNSYKNSSDTEQNDWIKSFTDYMEGKVVGWASCGQLEELKAMAESKNAERQDWDLEHMNLSTKEFIAAKQSFSYLAPYSSSNQEVRFSNKGPNQPGGHNDWRSQPAGSKASQPVSGNKGPKTEICVLLEEKTKKGGWRAAIKDKQEICGPITNSAVVPADKKAGDEIQLEVKVEKGDKSSFEYKG